MGEPPLVAHLTGTHVQRNRCWNSQCTVLLGLKKNFRTTGLYLCKGGMMDKGEARAKKNMLKDRGEGKGRTKNMLKRCWDNKEEQNG